MNPACDAPQWHNPNIAIVEVACDCTARLGRARREHIRYARHQAQDPAGDGRGCGRSVYGGDVAGDGECGRAELCGARRSRIHRGGRFRRVRRPRRRSLPGHLSRAGRCCVLAGGPRWNGCEPRSGRWGRGSRDRIRRGRSSIAGRGLGVDPGAIAVAMSMTRGQTFVGTVDEGVRCDAGMGMAVNLTTGQVCLSDGINSWSTRIALP